MSVGGTVSDLGIENVLSISATFAVGESTVDVSVGGATLTGATLFTLGLSNVQASAGTGDFGISASGGDLGIAVLDAPAPTTGNNDSRYWLAVVGSGLAGTLDLGGGVSAAVADGAVAINVAGGDDPSGNPAAPLNWKSALSENGGGEFRSDTRPGSQHRAGRLGVVAGGDDRRRGALDRLADQPERV